MSSNRIEGSEQIEEVVSQMGFDFETAVHADGMRESKPIKLPPAQEEREDRFVALDALYDFLPFQVLTSSATKCFINYGVVHDGTGIEIPQVGGADIKDPSNGEGASELTMGSGDYAWVEAAAPYGIVVNTEDETSQFAGYLIAARDGDNIKQYIKSDILLSGCEHAFAVKKASDKFYIYPGGFFVMHTLTSITQDPSEDSTEMLSEISDGSYSQSEVLGHDTVTEIIPEDKEYGVGFETDSVGNITGTPALGFKGEGYTNFDPNTPTDGKYFLPIVEFETVDEEKVIKNTIRRSDIYWTTHAVGNFLTTVPT